MQVQKKVQYQYCFSFCNEKELLINHLHYGAWIEAISSDIFPATNMMYQ